MQTAGSGPDSPSTAVFAKLPVAQSGHPGNLALNIDGVFVASLMTVEPIREVTAQTTSMPEARQGWLDYLKAYCPI